MVYIGLGKANVLLEQFLRIMAIVRPRYSLFDLVS